MALIKKRIRLQRYSRIVLQKSNMGHLDKIFRYKTLKSLRSYSAFKGQERFEGWMKRNISDNFSSAQTKKEK
jgi:hypothetical protein